MQPILYFSYYAHGATNLKLEGALQQANKMGVSFQEISQRPTPKLMRDLLAFWDPRGLIIDTPEATQQTFIPAAHLPIVFLDQDVPHAIPRASSISCDSSSIGRLAARELLSINYPHFAYIGFSPKMRWNTLRMKSFMEVLHLLHQKKCSVCNIPTLSSSSMNIERELSRFIQSLDKPCSIFCANDTLAQIVYNVIHALHFEIPHDIAVCGVDNSETLCLACKPSLSSIEVNFRMGGARAVSELLRLISDPTASPQNSLYSPSHLVSRRSTQHCFSVPTKKISRALKIIEENACNGITAEDVMALFSSSRTSVWKQFHKTVGHSILEEIHRVQLQHVITLLSRGVHAQRALCDFCGIASPSTLRKLFKRKMGLSIREWIRQGKM